MKINREDFHQQLDTFMINLLTCHKCNRLEWPINFEKLPTELQIHWAKMPKNSLFLYCENCDEWDVVKPREKIE